MRYDGQTCPVCEKNFTADDDIVVCPICGTPHHRACYLNNKDCAKKSLHASGYFYSPQEAAQAPTEKIENSTDNKHTVVFCPSCGKENSTEEPSCTSCGARLYFNNQRTAPTISIPSNNQYYNAEGRISPTETIGEITVADAAEFIQISANKYIPKFHKMDKAKSKVSWNWAAFIFAPYWFFFRKLHTIGFLLMIIILSVTGVASANADFLNRTIDISEKVYSFYTGDETKEDAIQEMYNFQKDPRNVIIVLTSFGVHLYAGLFGNYHYKKKTEKDVADLKKATTSDEQYRLSLFRKGGISGMMCALSWLGFFCANQIVVTLLMKLLL